MLRPPNQDPPEGRDPHTWHRGAALSKLLDKATRSRVTTGNSAELLVNGVEAFARRYENMRSARFIFLKTFIFHDDEEGRRMASELCKKAQAGIPVVVQYDVKGSVAKVEDIAEMLLHASPTMPAGERRIIRQMRDAGVWIVPTNSPDRAIQLREWFENAKRLPDGPLAVLRRSIGALAILDYCDHEKYFITGHADRTVRAIVGGMNIGSEYAWGGIADRRDETTGRPGWHDVDVEVRGPAAHVVYEEFLEDITRHAGRKISRKVASDTRSMLNTSGPGESGASIRFIASHPLHKRSRYTEELYRILLRATPPGEPIFIASPYFAPSKRIREAIIAHAKRGGPVVVLTNSIESNDIPIISEAAHYSALEIMKQTQNFQFYEWIPQAEKGEKAMHHKVASFGRFGPVVIGSFNLDAQSAVHNTEDLVVIDEPSFRERFDRLKERDLSPTRSKRVLKKDLETRPIEKRVRSFLTHELAWYWL